MEQEQKEKNAIILEWFDALIFALVIILIVLTFFFRTVTVEGISMVPTLRHQDQVILRSFLYKPKKGDIIVVDGYTSFGIPLVKRIIATGGDVVDIDFDKGLVYVNGEELDEKYISAPTTLSYDVIFPVEVPEGMLFIMGDNRPYSQDSRYSLIGFIDERDILGEVFFRILPTEGFGKLS